MIRRHILAVLSSLLFLSSSASAKSWIEDIDSAIFGQNSDIANYNAGVSLYKSGAMDEALSKFQLAAGSQDRILKSKAMHNAALIHIQKKEWQEAQDLLKQASAFHNESKEIKENLEWVAKRIDEADPEKKKEKDQEQKNAEQKEPKKDDDKTAEEKAAEKKASEQKSAEEKASEEKKGKKDDQGKEQGSEEKKVAKEGEKGKKDGKDQSSEGKGEKEKEPKAGEEKEAFEKSKDDKGKDGAKDKKGEAMGMSEAVPGQEIGTMSQAEIKQQEAERLLREIDDQIGRYPMIETEATGKRGNDGKNW